MSRGTTRLVIDTSALMALLLQEREAEEILNAVLKASTLLLSSGTRLELALVVESRHHALDANEVNDLLRTLAVEVVPFDQQQLHWALQGWRRYGKGRHPAALNLGDCFSYGLARALEAPLLFKGNDFGMTDVTVALPELPAN
jgi:ribonuclease VapC